MHVLVTRPKPDAVRTADKLKSLGHDVTVDSLFLIEPVEFDAPLGAFDAIAVTSANAVRVAAENEQLARFRPLPLFAVGAQTAEAARQAGFSKIVSASGDVQSLGKLLEDQYPSGARVLYLGGEDRAQDLAAFVAPSGIKVETLVVYRMKAAEHFAEETRILMRANKIDAVLHYSPRGSKKFIMLAEKDKLQAALSSPRHLCLSEAVAKPLIGVRAKIKVAARPDEEALLELLKD